jgi:hypothetical protein
MDGAAAASLILVHLIARFCRDPRDPAEIRAFDAQWSIILL